MVVEGNDCCAARTSLKEKPVVNTSYRTDAFENLLFLISEKIFKTGNMVKQ